MRVRIFRLLFWLACSGLVAACTSKGVMHLRPAGKKPAENMRAAMVDTVPLPPPRPDTLSEDAVRMLRQQYAERTEYIVASLVNAQKRAYEERYKEAEALLLQSLSTQPTADALLLLGSIYEVQGQVSRADSCWRAAKGIEATINKRTTNIPERQDQASKKRAPK